MAAAGRRQTGTWSSRARRRWRRPFSRAAGLPLRGRTWTALRAPSSSAWVRAARRSCLAEANLGRSFDAQRRLPRAARCFSCAGGLDAHDGPALIAPGIAGQIRRGTLQRRAALPCPEIPPTRARRTDRKQRWRALTGTRSLLLQVPESGSLRTPSRTGSNGSCSEVRIIGAGRASYYCGVDAEEQALT